MITEPIVIYGTEDCSYCDKAKNLADELAFDYTYINIKGNQPVLDMFRMRGWASVPQVCLYQDGELKRHIGGYTDFKAWAKRNYNPSQITITGERL
jgi:glutaredoxin